LPLTRTPQMPHHLLIKAVSHLAYYAAHYKRMHVFLGTSSTQAKSKRVRQLSHSAKILYRIPLTHSLTHSLSHSLTHSHSPTHARTHARTRARARTHTHTHTQCSLTLKTWLLVCWVQYPVFNRLIFTSQKIIRVLFHFDQIKQI
jgi:hypothetical protein